MDRARHPRRVAALSALLLAGASLAQEAETAAQRPAPVCDPDNGGLSLPEGFCALVVAEKLGRARHLVVADNGDIYVALGGPRGGIAALRDEDGDGRADRSEKFGHSGGTGIGIHGDYLYFAPDTAVWRYRLRPGELLPEGESEIIVKDFPRQGSHAAKPFTFDTEGRLYVNVGAPSNACQREDRAPGSPGRDPCPQLDRAGGVWRFDADRPGQRQQSRGTRYATGIRNGVANDWNPVTAKLYVVQHGRDQLSELWPEHFDAEQRAELPAEEMFEVEEGDDFGWPYCYYDPFQKRKVLAPEYGGDGRKVGRCSKYEDPVVAFPAHWGPNDLQFYFGSAFPARYRGGAFVAFHGSWNRQPFAQRGYLVAFVPFRDGKAVGGYEIFADGFAGVDEVRSPRDARYRPTGLAVGPDGSLYVSDSVKGRIWRVLYEGS